VILSRVNFTCYVDGRGFTGHKVVLFRSLTKSISMQDTVFSNLNDNMNSPLMRMRIEYGLSSYPALLEFQFQCIKLWCCRRLSLLSLPPSLSAVLFSVTISTEMETLFWKLHQRPLHSKFSTLSTNIILC
jgi:hypothetical protein